MGLCKNTPTAQKIKVTPNLISITCSSPLGSAVFILSRFVFSVVLSSLRHASEASGHDLPAEIGGLSWMSFFFNAALVVLQLAKPELDDTEGVYIRVVGPEGVVSSTAADSRGWQGFWAGGAAVAAGDISATSKNAGRGWCWCFRGRRRRGDGLDGGGAWPIAGGDGALNESLLGTGGFDDRTGAGGTLPFKAGEGARGGGGYFQRVGCFLSSAVGRRNNAGGAAAAAESAATAAAAAAAAEDDEEEGRLPRGHGSPYGNLRGGGASIRAQQALGSSSSSPYSGSASIGARAPPQVAAPVFSVAVSRWRLVDADGVPTAHGSSGDVMWTERSRHGSSSSVRTATLSTATLAGSDLGLTAGDGGHPRDRPGPSSASASVALNDFDVDEARSGSAGGGAEPIRVEFELLVRASGRGEMDWWGRGDPGGSTAGAAAADGDWRVWRSAADTLALYDALALRFGQDFGRRVSRPSFKTHKKHVRFAIEGADDGARSPPAAPARDSTPVLVLPGAFHRVDVLSDAKRVGAFLRSLLGLRQFLR